jgi:hypothetical protein
MFLLLQGIVGTAVLCFVTGFVAHKTKLCSETRISLFWLMYFAVFVGLIAAATNGLNAYQMLLVAGMALGAVCMAFSQFFTLIILGPNDFKNDDSDSDTADSASIRESKRKERKEREDLFLRETRSIRTRLIVFFTGIVLVVSCAVAYATKPRWGGPNPAAVTTAMLLVGVPLVCLALFFHREILRRAAQIPPWCWAIIYVLIILVCWTTQIQGAGRGLSALLLPITAADCSACTVMLKIVAICGFVMQNLVPLGVGVSPLIRGPHPTRKALGCIMIFLGCLLCSINMECLLNPMGGRLPGKAVVVSSIISGAVLCLPVALLFGCVAAALFLGGAVFLGGLVMFLVLFVLYYSIAYPWIGMESQYAPRASSFFEGVGQSIKCVGRFVGAFNISMWFSWQLRALLFIAAPVLLVCSFIAVVAAPQLFFGATLFWPRCAAAMSVVRLASCFAVDTGESESEQHSEYELHVEDDTRERFSREWFSRERLRMYGPAVVQLGYWFYISPPLWKGLLNQESHLSHILLSVVMVGLIFTNVMSMGLSIAVKTYDFDDDNFIRSAGRAVPLFFVDLLMTIDVEYLITATTATPMSDKQWLYNLIVAIDFIPGFFAVFSIVLILPWFAFMLLRFGIQILLWLAYFLVVYPFYRAWGFTLQICRANGHRHARNSCPHDRPHWDASLPSIASWYRTRFPRIFCEFVDFVGICTSIFYSWPIVCEHHRPFQSSPQLPHCIAPPLPKKQLLLTEEHNLAPPPPP